MTGIRHHNALAAGYRLHWYRIESVLGQGGFGITYLATDTNLDQPVAIKEFLPSDLAVRTQHSSVHPVSDAHGDTFGWGLSRFLTEARTLAQFRHPNIVRVYSVFEANGTAYMVMEYERGTSLEDAFKFRHLEGEAALVSVVHALMDGLELVHQAGFIHRDIKPDNIYMRANDGVPVLLDFGSARQAVGVKAKTLTSLVTPGYAPFEQYNATRGNDRQGPWTDVYSLAATLYRGITGNGPIDALARADAMLSGKSDPLIPLVAVEPMGFSTTLLEAVDAGLAFQPHDRPQSLAEWRIRLPSRPTTPDFAVAARTQDAAPRANADADAVTEVRAGEPPPGVTTHLADAAASVAPPLAAPSTTGTRSALRTTGTVALVLLLAASGWAAWWLLPGREAVLPRDGTVTQTPPTAAAPPTVSPAPVAEPAQVVRPPANAGDGAVQLVDERRRLEAERRALAQARAKFALQEEQRQLEEAQRAAEKQARQVAKDRDRLERERLELDALRAAAEARSAEDARVAQAAAEVRAAEDARAAQAAAEIRATEDARAAQAAAEVRAAEKARAAQAAAEARATEEARAAQVAAEVQAAEKARAAKAAAEARAAEKTRAAKAAAEARAAEKTRAAKAAAEARAAEKTRAAKAAAEARAAEETRAAKAAAEARAAEETRAAQVAAEARAAEKTRAAQVAAEARAAEKTRAARAAAEVRAAEEALAAKAAEASRAASSAPAQGKGRNAELSALLEAAAADVAALRLTSPPGRNAFERYRAALAMDPGNAEARAGFERIVTRYLALSEEAVRERNFPRGSTMLDRAARVDPDDLRVAAMRETLARAQRDAEARDTEARRIAVETAERPAREEAEAKARDGSPRKDSAGPGVKLAVFPHDTSRTCFHPVGESLHDAAKRTAAAMSSMELTYSSYVAGTPAVARGESLWQGIAGKKTPKVSAVQAAARTVGADAVLMAWYDCQSESGANESTYRADVYLVDVRTGEVYFASRGLPDTLKAARTVLRALFASRGL